MLFQCYAADSHLSVISNLITDELDPWDSCSGIFRPKVGELGIQVPIVQLGVSDYNFEVIWLVIYF